MAAAALDAADATFKGKNVEDNKKSVRKRQREVKRKSEAAALHRNMLK